MKNYKQSDLKTKEIRKWVNEERVEEEKGRWEKLQVKKGKNALPEGLAHPIYCHSIQTPIPRTHSRPP